MRPIPGRCENSSTARFSSFEGYCCSILAGRHPKKPCKVKKTQPKTLTLPIFIKHTVNMKQSMPRRNKYDILKSEFVISNTDLNLCPDDGKPEYAFIGWSNVGKSSLTNALCGAEIFEADMLFATLDPTARKCTLPSGLQVILVDTVGFVSRLPHDLVDAFKSTLEEAACSDIILKIADASDSEAAEQLSVTDEVLNDLGCGDIPQVTVYNKCDRTGVAPYDPDVLLVSAKTGYGLDSLLAKIDEILAHRVRTIEVLLPYDKLALADVFRTRGSVLAEEYRENGVYYKATVKVDDLHRFEAYLL